MADFGTLNFSVAFNPSSGFPLDARYYFDSLESAQAAAATAVEVGSADSKYFIGENVVVVTSSEATLYVIQPNKTLKAVGSSVVTDNKTISTVDGTLSLKDFGVQYYAYIPGEDSQPGSWAESPTSGFKAGLEPKIRQVSAGQYELAWYEPATDTTAGLQSAVAQLQQDVSNLQTQVSEIPTWEDIESVT